VQIVVNTRLLFKDRLEGIGWFSYQTLRHITQSNPDVHFVFLFDRDFDEEFIFSENITPLILSPQARHPLLYYTWFQFSVKNILKKLKPDLFLSPDGFLSLGAPCRQLPVIHDINFLHYPEDSKWLTAKYYNHFFPKFASEATRIATVSEFSKNEIAINYKIDPQKIDVVYNGINPFFRIIDERTKHHTRERFSFGKNYFVSVGALHPRKNIPNLIQAFSLFKKETGSDYKLLLAGPGFWGLSAIQNAIDESGSREDVVFTGRLIPEDIAAVLGSATALTFVPYYEGFGIPLVEAMEAGVPIITSNVTSLPEIAGEAALLVDPSDVLQIKTAMVRIFSNESLRKNLVQKGFERKQKFSWEQSAGLLWQSIVKATD
jgi:glycosyltransferase involved in cell wall biosynthesis